MRPPRDVLLQDVVLQRAVQLRRIDALLLPHRDIERQQDGRRRVDRHRRADLVQRDPLEERLHVRQARYGHARAPHLARRQRMVGVVARLRRQVERHAQARLSVFEQVAIPRVRLLRRREPGVLPHRPHAPPVHIRLDAASVRVLARISERVRVLEPRKVLRRVDGADLHPGVRLEAVPPLPEPLLHRLERAVVPFLLAVGGHWLVVSGLSGYVAVARRIISSLGYAAMFKYLDSP